MSSEKNSLGFKIHALAKRLWPINRSLTGNGVRKTLEIISKEIPIEIHEVKTGEKNFDWNP